MSELMKQIYYALEIAVMGDVPITLTVDQLKELIAEIDRLKSDLAETQACLLERNIQLDCERKQRRWIPVSERLPEIDDGYCIEVWAVNMNSLKPMAFRVDYTNFDGFETLIATHWMPIEAPKNLPPPEDK